MVVAEFISKKDLDWLYGLQQTRLFPYIRWDDASHANQIVVSVSAAGSARSKSRQSSTPQSLPPDASHIMTPSCPNPYRYWEGVLALDHDQLLIH